MNTLNFYEALITLKNTYDLETKVEKGYISMDTLISMQKELLDAVQTTYEEGQPELCAGTLVDCNFLLTLMQHQNLNFGL